MMRRREVLHIGVSGGIGDALLLTPTLRALKMRYPSIKLRVHVASRDHLDVFRNNPHIDTLRLESKAVLATVGHLLNFGLLRINIKLTNYSRDYPSLFFNGDDRHATLLISRIFDLTLEDKKLDVFLSSDEEETARRIVARYRRPVILHNTAAFSKTKEWPLDRWRALVSRNQDLDFIQVGNDTDSPVSGCVDLRGKGTLRISFALIKHAVSFVGVDSAMAHVTNAFDVPGVVLYGPSDPKIWGHSNNINLYRGIRCSPCIDFLVGQRKCPYLHECMNDIEIDDVEKSLRYQIERRLG